MFGDKEALGSCPLCGKVMGGYDKPNNTIWCDDEKCPLFEEISIMLWIAIHERLEQ